MNSPQNFLNYEELISHFNNLDKALNHFYYPNCSKKISDKLLERYSDINKKISEDPHYTPSNEELNTIMSTIFDNILNAQLGTSYDGVPVVTSLPSLLRTLIQKIYHLEATVTKLVNERTNNIAPESNIFNSVMDVIKEPESQIINNNSQNLFFNTKMENDNDYIEEIFNPPYPLRFKQNNWYPLNTPNVQLSTLISEPEINFINREYLQLIKEINANDNIQVIKDGDIQLRELAQTNKSYITLSSFKSDNFFMNQKIPCSHTSLNYIEFSVCYLCSGVTVKGNIVIRYFSLEEFITHCYQSHDKQIPQFSFLKIVVPQNYKKVNMIITGKKQKKYKYIVTKEFRRDRLY